MSLPLREALECAPAARVIVVGDVMLDRYLSGSVERISPEAPVEIFEQGDQTHTPGGAANVAGGIAALGGRVILLSVVGNDPEADTLQALLSSSGIGEACLLRASDRPTTVKTRLVAQGHQVMRLDHERRAAIDDSLSAQIEQQFSQYLPDCQALVLSDYNKGVLTPDLVVRLISRASARQVPVLVDPKSWPWDHFTGATLLKPNWNEFTKAVGGISSEQDFFEKAERLRDHLHLAALLVTHGAEGMVLFQSGQAPAVIPAVRQEVYDITGAGDTAIATLAFGMAAGLGMLDAIELSNLAASLAVRRFGTSLIRREALLDALSNLEQQRKIYTLETLAPIVHGLKQRGKHIVFTNGCFDILHVGHLTLLEQAHHLGDILVVGVNSDQSVRKLKGAERPIMQETDRARVLAALQTVDYVVTFAEPDPLKVIEALHPDVHVKGADYIDGQKPIPEKAVVEAYGGRVVFVPLVADYSTTHILRQIKDQPGEAKPPT